MGARARKIIAGIYRQDLASHPAPRTYPRVAHSSELITSGVRVSTALARTVLPPGAGKGTWVSTPEGAGASAGTRTCGSLYSGPLGTEEAPDTRLPPWHSHQVSGLLEVVAFSAVPAEACDTLSPQLSCQRKFVPRVTLVSFHSTGLKH